MATDLGTVRVASLLGVAEALRRRGLDPVQMLVAVSLEPDTFDFPERRIPYIAAGDLLRQCSKVTGCTHFGLLAGEHLRLSTLGLLSDVVSHCASVGAALESLILHLQTRGGIPTHTVEGQSATFGYAIYMTDTQGTVQAHDLVMAFEFNIMKDLCGPQWRPTEVLFAHGQPKDLLPYQTFFGCPLQFDADRTTLVFHRDWLKVRPAGLDTPGSALEAGRGLVKEWIELEADLIERVRRALRSMISTGRTSELLLADLMSMSTRTLNRKLTARGSSFRILVDEVRQEVARQLLSDTDMSTAEVASALGYADASAFTRATRRWIGLPPALWRARIKFAGMPPAALPIENF